MGTLYAQVDTYKYVVWVPGNCASVRLALQLASDCLVLKVETPEEEWYYGMLKPYEHYVPLHANSSYIDVVEAVQWAEAHPLEVRTWLPPLRLCMDTLHRHIDT